MNDLFYKSFEDQHRGSRSLIKSRLTVYAPFVKSLQALCPHARAIDLGCGRGEWLELLAEMGLDAYGIDLDEGMLGACRALGLRAHKADALETLQGLSSESMMLVSGFHIVEHMPFEDVRRLVSEALRVLKPGGLLILETPNPENPHVGACSFYMDPSHQRPIPLDLLSFVVEHAGFARHKVMRLQESPELHSATRVNLLDVLIGVSPDYAVVAQKNASENLFHALDGSFDEKYGISLGELAQRFDAQVIHDNWRIDVLETRFVQAESRLVQAEARLVQAESRLVQAESRLVQAESRLHEIEHSFSWRLTASFRLVSQLLSRCLSAFLKSSLGGKTKKMLKPGLRRAGSFILRFPRLTRITLQILSWFPGIKARLQVVMHERIAADLSQRVQQTSALSLRAERIHAQLITLVDAERNKCES